MVFGKRYYVLQSADGYKEKGVASWYDFAVAIMELSGLNCKVNPLETKAYPTPARRGWGSI